MEKEQILSTINEKLEAEGIKSSQFQRTFGTYMEKHLPAEGTEPDDAYFNEHVDFFKSLAGQYNHDVATQVEDFKKNYKPKTSTTDPANKGGDPDLLKRIEQLEQQNAMNAKNASAAALRSEVTASGKSPKVANEAIWADAVEAVQVGDNDTADDVAEKAKKIYEQKLRRYMGEGVAPYGSSGRLGANKEAEKEMADRRERFKEKMRRSGKLPRKENQ